MAQKELVYKVKILDETGNIVEVLAQDINTLNKSVKDLENELSGTELGSEQFKDLQKELKNSKGALDEAKKSGMSFSDQLSAIPGPIGGVVSGVKGMGAAFKILLANPVALFLTIIVTALTALFKAFTSTKEGGEKMAQMMAALGAVMDVVRDVAVTLTKQLIKLFSDPVQALKDLGKFLQDQITNRVEGLLELLPALGKAIKLAFSGNFKEAGKVAVDAVSKVTLGVENLTDKVGEGIGAIKKLAQEAVSEAQKAASLKKELQAIDDAQRDLNNRRAEQNKLIAEAKLKINDETLSIEQRLAALEDVRKTEVALAEAEAALAQRRFNAIKAQNALSDSSKEALDAEAAAYQQLQAALLASTQKQKELYDQGVALRNRSILETKAVADLERSLRLASVTDEQERKKAELKAAMEGDLQAIELLKTTEEKKVELRLLAEEKYQKGLDDIEIERVNKEKEKTQKEFEAETARLDALLELERLKYDGEGELAEADLQRTLDLMKQKTELLLSNDKLTAEQRLLIETQYSDAVTKLDKDVFDAKKEISQKVIEQRMKEAQASVSALNMIAMAAGEATLVGKAAAVASATINTYLAASQVLADEFLPTVLKPFAVAAAIALGLKQVQTIVAIQPKIPEPKIPKLSRGGIVFGQGSETLDSIPAMLSNGESVINARSTAMFAPVLDTINQLGGGASFDGSMRSNSIDPLQMELLSGVRQNNTNPIRAFVVASEASSQIQLERQTKNRSLV